MGSPASPFQAVNFRVEIDGLTVGSFSEVTGLSADGAVVEYREGTDFTRSTRKLPGLRSYPNIVMKRGYTTNRELWDWYRNIANGLPDRRNGSVILMDEARNDALRWDFENAWIKKIEGPAFNAAENKVAFESVELVHEGVTLA